MAKELKRDSSIDLRRFIGFTLIVLAHIGMSRQAGESALFQLRSFDVPLMVFVSGLAFSGKDTGAYLPFIFKRTLRLLVPVYIFVTAYMLLNPVLADLGWVEVYSPERMAGTYGLRLNPSIGYVWIIRVFLIVMLVTPLLTALEKKIKQGWVLYAVVLLMLGVQTALTSWLKSKGLDFFGKDWIMYLVKDWGLYIFGYSAVFTAGLRFRKASVKEKLLVMGMFLAVVAASAWFAIEKHGTWLCFQQYKYPPRLYFLSYGVLVSSFLWLTSKVWTKVMDNSLFTFIGRNTIWIYLWHIPFVNLVVSAKGYAAPFADWSLVAKYAFVYLCALGMFGLQYWLVTLAERRWPKNIITKYFKG